MPDVKNVILALWMQVNRPGMDRFIEYLTRSDFFSAPCSTKFHLSKPGGLAEHSLNVYNLLSEKMYRYQLEIPKESIIICALGHDLCKVDYYTTEQKWRKDANNQWEKYETYVVKDQFPMGHGEKSVSILQDFIKLEDFEKLAIRWHMAAWDLSDYSGRWAFNEAVKKTPLVTLLSTADFEATNILEREGEN